MDGKSGWSLVWQAFVAANAILAQVNFWMFNSIQLKLSFTFGHQFIHVIKEGKKSTHRYYGP